MGQEKQNSQHSQLFAETVGKLRPVQIQQRVGDALQAAMAHQLQSLHQYAAYPAAAGSWHEGLVDLLQSEPRY